MAHMPEDKFEKLARLIKEEGEETREQLRAEFNLRFETLNTKTDNLTTRVDGGFLELGHRVSAIEKELERLLERLAEQAASNSGFAKEIDGLRAEIIAIKRHMGLTEIVA